MDKFTKVVRLGTKHYSENETPFGVYCKISFEDEKLSITGVEGPLNNGNCRGSCGQIDMSFDLADMVTFAPGWSADKIAGFLNIWHEWHLNDLQAGCEHQRKLWDTTEKLTLADGDTKTAGWVYPSEHPKGLLTKPCPECGYKYGTAWLKKEVPEDVLEYLRDLPDTDKQPAWV